MSIVPSRLVIYTQDIVIITGRSLKVCRKIMKELRLALNKKSHEFVTAAEFSERMKIDLHLVLAAINRDAIK